MDNPPEDNAKSERKVKVVQVRNGLKRWTWQTIPSPCPPDKNLATLPNKILSMIAARVGRKDLLAFRATSKQLHGNSVATFIVRFIHDVKVMLTRKSLQALVDISQHEVFGPHVRAIGIDPTSFCTDRCTCDATRCHRCRGVAPWYQSHPFTTHSDWSDESDSDAEERVRKTEGGKKTDCRCPLAKRWSCCREQQEKVSLGDVLREAFTNLTKHGQSLCLSVGDYGIKTIGYQDFLESHAHRFWKKTQLSTVYKELLKTAANCKLKVQQLSIQIAEDDGKEKSSGSLLLTASEIEHASAILSRLRRIDLRLAATSMLWDVLEDSCDTMARLLPVSNNLEALTLNTDLEDYTTYQCLDVDEMQDSDPLGKLARSIASTKLSELDLHCVYGYEADLKELISKHAGSLKSLNITCCCIWEGGSWSQLFSWMLENLSLDKLMVSDLMIHRGPVNEGLELPTGMDFWRPEAVGKKAVEKFMRTIIKESAFQEKGN